MLLAMLAAAPDGNNKLIEQFPKVKLLRAAKGYWIKKPYLLGYSYFCSICGNNYGMPHEIYKYCPHCGAVMEPEADKEFTEKHNYIRNRMTEPALYEALAEEATELAMAALKYARVLRGENPTHLKKDEVKNNLIEEFTDVHCVADVINLTVDPEIKSYKFHRWYERLKEVENGEKA